MVCPKCGKEINESTKFCDGCGEEIIQSPVLSKKKPKKKLIAIIAALVAVIILVVSLASDGGGGLTVESDNDTGAVLNITLDEYTENFGVKLDELYVLAGGQAVNFDLEPYWNNKVEPMTGYEENSGAEYTLYTAFLTGTHIGASIQDDKIESIDICFDYDENSMAVVSACTTIMICGDMEFEEANKIFETIRNGIADNTMVYKDGILYTVTASTVSYTIMAASEDFVQRLENSGNCNVLRW